MRSGKEKKRKKCVKEIRGTGSIHTEKGNRKRSKEKEE